MTESSRNFTILGQDPDILVAAFANILSWIVSTFVPSFLPFLLPKLPEEEPLENTLTAAAPTSQTQCISIGRPGGMEQLRLVTLKEGICTIGYNVKHVSPPPYAPLSTVPADCVVVRNKAFSVNYADCTIRWGLYESAKKFVGWPIVPGFDFAGTVECVSCRNNDSENSNDAHHGDQGAAVFGCTLFGAYSTRILVPKIQLRKIPDCLTFSQAAACPAVSLTALYALHLAGYFPVCPGGGSRIQFTNKSILIHSAAGGVGSFLVQMSKILGLFVVGVVGSSSKVQDAEALGCNIVIDKSKENLWAAAEKACPNGYGTIMDANGVSTLRESYDHLAHSGRLIVFGFHSNLPIGSPMLSPMEWLRMAKRAASMPKFDAMDLTVSNKAVLGFNLSFFADEVEILSDMFDQILLWINGRKLKCPRVVEMSIENIAEAHSFIQSGKSSGKIVLTTGC